MKKKAAKKKTSEVTVEEAPSAEVRAESSGVGDAEAALSRVSLDGENDEAETFALPSKARDLWASVESQDAKQVAAVLKSIESNAPNERASDDEAPDLRDFVDENGWSVLFLACCDGNKAVVKALLKDTHIARAHLSLVDVRGHTPLHIAALENNANILELLLDAGADATVQDNDGKSALHLAAFEGHADVIRLLCKRGVAPDPRDSEGWSPLHQAAAEGQHECARALLECKHPVDCEDARGWTPLHLAASSGYQDVVYLLVLGGASIDAANKVGRTPLHCALSEGWTDTASLLVEGGADLNQRDHRGKTALHEAATCGVNVIPLFTIFVSNGADLCARDEYGKTPLHWACGDGNLEVVKFVAEKLENTDWINVADERGFTPFLEATFQGHHDLALYLADHGADLAARSKKSGGAVEMLASMSSRMRHSSKVQTHSLQLIERLESANVKAIEKSTMKELDALKKSLQNPAKRRKAKKREVASKTPEGARLARPRLWAEDLPSTTDGPDSPRKE